jgi:glycosyltransferase involved in cell wall biosynthesis
VQVLLDNIIFSLQKYGGISMYWAEMTGRPPFDEARFVEREDAARNAFRAEMHPKGKRLPQPELPLLLDRLSDVNARTVKGKLFHSSYYRLCSDPDATNITTVYDFINERHRTGLGSRIHSMQKMRAIGRSRGVICISKSTYDDLKSLAPKLPSAVEVIPMGISADYHPLTEVEIWKTSAEASGRRLVLFVGSRAHYKNFDKVVEALSDMRGYELVIVGGGNPSRSEQIMLEYALAGRYRYYGNVTNERLNAIYNACRCLLYPSSYEGFGIPVGEAMRAGCPVIVARVSSIPEVAGDAALYLEQITAEGIKGSLRKLESEGLRTELAGKGLDRSNSFSWEKTASETYEFYKTVWTH